MDGFSGWLAERRRAAGLTQGELAERVGCSKSYISTLERGATHSMPGGMIRPSLELVDALADALDAGRSSARLAAGYAPPSGMPDPEPILWRRLDKHLRRLPPDRRAKAEDALEKMAEALVATAA